jgi:hypothetical protein
MAGNNQFSKFVPDYEKWFKKRTIEEGDAYLLMHGVEPKDFERYSKDDSLRRDRRLLDDKFWLEYDRFLASLTDITGAISVPQNKPKGFRNYSSQLKWENVWNGDLYHLCNELYERCYVLPESLLKFLESKNKRPTHFDHYKDEQQYVADYSKWLKDSSLKNIAKEDALYLFLGLEPKFGKKYRDIFSKYDSSIELNRWENEDRFFYKSYDYYSVNHVPEIRNCPEYKKGEFFNFVQELYNAGYTPCDELISYLKKIGREPKYDEDGEIYKHYKEYSEKPRWSIEEFACLMWGKHPRCPERRMITCFNSFNELNFRRIPENNDYHVSFSDGTHSLYAERDFLSRYQIKDADGYYPKELLELVIKHTKIKPPKLLVEMVFDEMEEGSSSSLQSESRQLREVKTTSKSKRYKDILKLILGKKKVINLVGYQGIDSFNLPESCSMKVCVDELQGKLSGLNNKLHPYSLYKGCAELQSCISQSQFAKFLKGLGWQEDKSKKRKK